MRRIPLFGRVRPDGSRDMGYIADPRETYAERREGEAAKKIGFARARQRLDDADRMDRRADALEEHAHRIRREARQSACTY